MKVQSRSGLRVLVPLLVLAILVGNVAAGEVEENDFVTLLSGPGNLEIVRHPPAADYTQMDDRGKITLLPSYDAGNPKHFQIDLRSCDLSALDVRDRLSDLIQADFDSKTVWPAQLPPGFDFGRIMELGKNPGLGLRAVHRRGITGKGVGLAIIDMQLLVDHVEYKDQLRLYEEIHVLNGSTAGMHGPAVASIAVGKTVGVAPQADLYFIAEYPGRAKSTGLGPFFDMELNLVAQAIDRIVAINNTLRSERKIRVISMSMPVMPLMSGFTRAKQAIARASKEGIYTVYVRSDPYEGLAREPLVDPNPFGSYLTDDLPARAPRNKGNASPVARLVPFLSMFADKKRSRLLVPRDSRCTAAPTGDSDYAFYRKGGPSWTVPWIAGLYALACQVRPDITPELFWEMTRKTSVEGSVQRDGTDVVFGRIINPVALLDALQSEAGAAVE